MKEVKIKQVDKRIVIRMETNTGHSYHLWTDTPESIVQLRDACNEFLEHNEDKLEKVRDEKRSCANCAKFNVCTQQVSPTKPYCSEYMLAGIKPKEAKEKPKKRVTYICRGCNCKCIIKLQSSCDVLPNCLYGDIYKANWKLKVVK